MPSTNGHACYRSALLLLGHYLTKGAKTMGTDIQAARQGLLKFIAKKGGSMRDLHTHSLVFYQAGHQAFSQLMEGLVADEYVTCDDDARVFQLSDKGRAFLESQVS